MVQAMIKEPGGLDILINSAGIQTRVASHEMASESFACGLGVNLHG
jgi:NAD(P)-dependent dehydrogenase (short-subunit alcohol dehydrogenase family)